MSAQKAAVVKMQLDGKIGDWMLLSYSVPIKMALFFIFSYVSGWCIN
jgi:hypothetical protein